MKLDYYQEKAASSLYGNSIIIAGAGSGKTTTLLGKIEKLMQKGVEENEILVISFTNESVNNFKNKCKYSVDIFTFHKAAIKLGKINRDILDGEYILEDVIMRVLGNIPDKLKKYLYKSQHSIFDIYTEKKYNEYINNKNSDSILSNIKSIIKIAKTNNINIEKIDSSKFSKKEIIILYICKVCLEQYNNYLKSNNVIDFDDMIIEATKNINDRICLKKYKYIMVDEYQDISKIRLDFLKSIVEYSKANLTVVGDDFQSIFGFSGSNLELFYNFSKYFSNVKVFKIINTYRCPQKLITKAGKFIMKNKSQIKKELISSNKTNNCLKKIYTKKFRLDNFLNKYIHNKKSILILSRNNFDINKYCNKKLIIKESYVYLNGKKMDNIRFMSIHSSKGLESDIVIILNLSDEKNGFPSLKRNHIGEKILDYKEKIKYAEERRLFYVALTRAKEKVYLIVDQEHPSRFIKEI